MFQNDFDCDKRFKMLKNTAGVIKCSNTTIVKVNVSIAKKHGPPALLRSSSMNMLKDFCSSHVRVKVNKSLKHIELS